MLEELEGKNYRRPLKSGDPHFFQQAHDVTDAKLRELSDFEAELKRLSFVRKNLEEKKTQAEAKIGDG